MLRLLAVALEVSGHSAGDSTISWPTLLRLRIVLVLSGCYDKKLYSEFENNKNVLLIVWRQGNPRCWHSTWGSLWMVFLVLSGGTAGNMGVSATFLLLRPNTQDPQLQGGKADGVPKASRLRGRQGRVQRPGEDAEPSLAPGREDGGHECVPPWPQPGDHLLPGPAS